MLRRSVRDIPKSSSWWAPRVTCRSGGCCRDCSICAVPVSFPAAGSSASLDDLDPDGFRRIARGALDQFSSRKVDEADWAAFSAILNYVPMSAAACVLTEAVEAAQHS